MAIWDLPAHLWTFTRRIEELLALQSRTTEALKGLEQRLDALEDRMTHLEAAQIQLVDSAKAAASVTAAGVSGSVISDIVTRVTRVEMQQANIQARLPPPS